MVKMQTTLSMFNQHFFLKWLTIVLICFLNQIVINAAVTLTLSSGDLVITGDAANEDLEINYSSPNYVIISNVAITTAIAGATGSGTTTVTIPEGNVNGVNVDLKDGIDRLFIKGLPSSVNGSFTVTDGDDEDQVFIEAPINTGTNDININTELMTVNAAGDLTTTTGAITLNALGRILINVDAIVTSTSGNIIVNANPAGTTTGAFNAFYLLGSITTTSGAISITGKSGDSGNSDGVLLGNGSSISSTGMGAGDITINGSSIVTDNASADGVFMDGAAMIASASAPISITGTAAIGEGFVIGGTITATNTATITVNGNNTAAANTNRGIRAAGATISSVNGDISLIGSSTHSTSIGDIGTLVDAGSSVTSSGTGSISISGTTNSTSDAGLFIEDASMVSTNSGHVTLIGENDSTIPDDIIFNNATNAISSTSGNITITADDVRLVSVSVSGTGVLTIQPKTANGAIGLGGGGGTLNLSDADLLNIQDGFSQIIIGDITNGTGTITIQSATFTDPVTFAGGTIVDADDAGDDIAASTNAVTIDGDLSSGSSPGIFQVTGNTALTSGENFNVEIDGGTTAGTDYDQLKVVGTVNLAGATLSLSGAYSPNGEDFTVVDNDGADAVIGTFNGLAEGATISFNTIDLTISYTGGDGNDVVLTAESVTTVASTWTGATDTDWYKAGNWTAGVPGTITDVTIPNTTNQPTIGSGNALAKQVTINASATLTVNATATLTIENSNTGGARNHGLLLSGTVANAGTINISNTAENGIYTISTGGIITNSGTININTTALDGFINRGTFTNQTGGNLNIGTTGGALNIGSIGIRNRGAFDNQAGATTTIDNIAAAEAVVTTTSSISFTNSGTFTILKAGTRGIRHTTGTFITKKMVVQR